MTDAFRNPEAAAASRARREEALVKLRDEVRRAPKSYAAERHPKIAERALSSASARAVLICLECCGGDRPEAKRCESMSCANWIAGLPGRARLAKMMGEVEREEDEGEEGVEDGGCDGEIE